MIERGVLEGERGVVVVEGGDWTGERGREGGGVVFEWEEDIGEAGGEGD